MPKGGARPGAGRKPGALTKRTREIAEGAFAEGLTPLEFMLNLLRDETQTLAVRADMAKSAAPYIHPRLANVEQKTELSGPDGSPLQVEDVSRALENALDRIKRKQGG